ncbi:MAG: GNAT family N-acetyltransferase [Chloroflexota bacterium]|nr:GNAT family N-acetyltransferase [Chloroflexota bacterium]
MGVFASDSPARQTLVGGVFGDLIWDWLRIESLWTSAEQRRRGIGSALMRHIEAAARERGVVNIHLETSSFQALPFYPALGYEVFGELPDHPIGSTWRYLRKFGAPL